MYIHVCTQTKLTRVGYKLNSPLIVPVILKKEGSVDPSVAIAWQEYFPAVFSSTVRGKATMTVFIVLLVTVCVDIIVLSLCSWTVTSDTHVSTWQATVILSPMVWLERSMLGISETISNGSKRKIMIHVPFHVLYMEIHTCTCRCNYHFDKICLKKVHVQIAVHSCV